MVWKLNTLNFLSLFFPYADSYVSGVFTISLWWLQSIKVTNPLAEQLLLFNVLPLSTKFSHRVDFMTAPRSNTIKWAPVLTFRICFRGNFLQLPFRPCELTKNKCSAKTTSYPWINWRLILIHLSQLNSSSSSLSLIPF